MGWHELNQLIAGTRLLTYADVDACGIPRSTFDDRTRREGWPDRPYPGVIATPGPRLDRRERIRAATLSIRGPVWVGGLSALYLHGVVDAPPTRTLLWVPVGQRASSSRVRQVRRSTLLTAEDSEPVDGIPVVPAAWALHDVAGATTHERLRNLAIDARFKGVMSEEDPVQVLRRDGRFAGRASYQLVVEDLRSDGSDSGFEFTTRDRLTAEGLPPDDAQARLWTPGRPRDVDIAYADYKVGLECEGLRYHGRDEQDRDAERSNDIAVLDEWLLLHLTFRMQFGDAWGRVLARLRRALGARGYPGLSPTGAWVQ